METWPHDQFRSQRRRPIDNGVYEVEVESLNDVPTKKGRRKFDVVHRVVKPEEFEGFPLYDSFTIGTKADSNAELPETWLAEKAVGARRFHDLFRAAGVKTSGNIFKDTGAIAGAHLMVEVVKEEEPLKIAEKDDDDNPTGMMIDNPYAFNQNGERRVRARVTRMNPIGTIVRGTSGTGSAPRARVCPTCGDQVSPAQYTEHMLAHVG